MFEIGIPELLIVQVILMIVLGTNKFPQLGTGLAKRIRSFNKRG